MKTVVVSPWYGATEELIAHFEAAVEGVDEVVIVDDGVTPETRRRLETIPRARIIVNEQNLGFAGSCNVGYAALNADPDDVICFLNSDITGPPRRLAKALAREVPENAIVGPATSRQWVLATPLDYLDGWCIAARHLTWDKLVLPGNSGPWDAASFPTPYWEDVDLSFRAATVGLGVEARQSWTFLKHLGGRSMGDARKWGESFEKNRATLLERIRPAWQQLIERNS